MSLENRGEGAGLARRIVDSGEHHIFERDAAAVLLIDVMPAGIEQFGYRMLLIDRHELTSQRIVACMQRYGERAVDLLRELADLRRKPRSRQRHAAAREVKTAIVEKNPQCRHHRAEIRKRLPHAHENHVSDDALARQAGLRALAKLAFGEPHLADNLRGREVAIEALLARRAERTVESAADLG